MRALRRGLAIALFLSGCGGGFYGIHGQPDVRAPLGDDAREPRYVSTVIELHNAEALAAPAFRGGRAAGLERLYVYASVRAAGDAGNKTVPLFLIDLGDHPRVDATEGAELISKLPVVPDARDQAFITIGTRALARSELDVALDTWRSTKSLIHLALTTPGGGQAIEAVDAVAGVLDRFSSREFQYDTSYAVPKTYTKEHVVSAYFLFPTDAAGVPDASVEAQIAAAKKSGVCLDDQGGAFLCDGARAPFDALPYVLVHSVLSDYLADADLLPRTIPATCGGIDAARVARASARLAEPAFSRWLSEDQRAEEQGLVDHAERLVAIRTALDKNDVPGAVNAYEALTRLSTSGSDLYRARFEERTRVLRRCADAAVRGVPEGEDIVRATGELLDEVDLEKAPVDDLESRLRPLAGQIGGADLGPDAAPRLRWLQDTILLTRLRSRAERIKTALLRRYYWPLIDVLQAAQARTDDADKAAETLRASMERSSCDKCILASRAAIRDYQGRALAGPAAQVERERADLVGEASMLRLAVDALRYASSDAAVVGRATASADAIAELEGRVAEPGALARGGDADRLREALAESRCLAAGRSARECAVGSRLVGGTPRGVLAAPEKAPDKDRP